jgi:hypothetical protein
MRPEYDADHSPPPSSAEVKNEKEPYLGACMAIAGDLYSYFITASSMRITCYDQYVAM